MSPSFALLFAMAFQPPDLPELRKTAENLRASIPASERRIDMPSREQLDLATRLERDLRDWVEPRLPPPADQDMDGFNRGIAAKLREAGVFRSEPNVLDDYIRTSRPVGYPTALLLEIGVTIAFGVDGVAYLYELTNGNWRRTLSLERNQNEFGTFLSSVHVSPVGARMDHLVVAVRTPISPAGCLHTLRYEAFRLDPGLANPVRVLDRSHLADTCDNVYLKMEPDGFLAEFQGWAYSPAIRRAHVLHYKMTGDQLRRVPPVALQPEDFVDEWRQATWSEAKEWTATPSHALENWHGNLSETFGDYEFVQRCRDVRKWQVGVSLESGESAYFLIRDFGSNAYQMLDIGPTRQLGCPGETRPSQKRPTLFPQSR
jgi:hypothetical protein